VAFLAVCIELVSVVTELSAAGAAWCQLAATVDVPRQRGTVSVLLRSDRLQWSAVTATCRWDVTDG